MASKESRLPDPELLALITSRGTPTDLLAPESALVWQYIGDPADRNVSLGPFDPTNNLGGSPFRNTFGAGVYACIFAEGLTNNTFANSILNVTAGLSFDSNEIGVDCRDCDFGDFNSYNTLGPRVRVVSTGTSCTGNTFAGGVQYVQLGDEVKDCIVGAGCNAVKLGSNCERVELYNCGGPDYTNTAPFTVPDGTTDAIYRNNVLQTGSGSGPGVMTRDLLDLTGAFMESVMALTYTNCDADPAASPAGSFPGQWFDAYDPVAGDDYHYYCGRGTYVPGNTSTGAGPAWHRVSRIP